MPDPKALTVADYLGDDPARRAGLPGPFSRDLYGDAALAAATTLAGHWREAVLDGTPLPALIEDVERTILVLRTWRTYVRRRAGLPPELPGEPEEARP
jgi:hypothetical protein